MKKQACLCGGDEGHDAMQSRHAIVRSKEIDQPMQLPSGKLTENGKFHRAAMAAKSGGAHYDHGPDFE